jgi:2-C-methyl-D-erythritol 2,4-cyclodiphosphate synthase
MRIGIGYDIHRLVSGRPLVLGGVTIAFAKGLEGHSDADVLLHAVCDALLGAAGMGDIGVHFPNDDPSYQGISSMSLLSRTWQMVSSRHSSIVNIDSTILAQAPRLSPYIEGMKKNIRAVLGMAPDRISIKATTAERLGFIGREEGIAAMCVVLID